MSKEHRKEIRYGLTDFNIKGEIILYPDPRALIVSIDDISNTGAGVSIVTELDDRLNEDLSLLVNAWRKGTRIPVQFSLNNTKIPTHIVSSVDKKRFGLLISDNAKLAALAERGRKLFDTVISGLIKRSVGESGPGGGGLPFSKDALPESIRAFMERGVSSGLIQRAVISGIMDRLPELSDKVGDGNEIKKIERLFRTFFGENGRDVLLLLGQILMFMEKQNPTAPLDVLLPEAVGKIFESDALFSDVLKRFESTLVDDYLKKRLPETFKDLDPKHPLAELVRTRFEAYTDNTLYLAKMAPGVCDYYITSYCRGDSEITALIDEMGEKLAKKTALPWVQNEINAVALGKIRGGATIIDDLFRQAIYEHITRSKTNGISFGEIHDITAAKLSEGFRDISEWFLTAICGLIDPAMKIKFAAYKEDTEEDRVNARSRNEADAKIKAMPPVELMKRFCWPSIVDMGEISRLQREEARSWIPKESRADYEDLGGAVIISRPAYEDFIANAGNESLMGETPQDFFQEVDLLKLYNETATLANGTVRKEPFGAYIDTLHPLWIRKMILETVINSPQWNRYYILNKTRRYFQKFFSEQAPDFIKFVEENMLSSEYAKADYI
jgi:hypothetical protein